MANELKFDILGTSFTITADADEEYLKKILSKYRAAVKNTQKISGISEPLNVAILTGFLLCDEYNKLKEQTEASADQGINPDDWDEAQEVEERTIRLITKLEHALNLFGENREK